MVGGDLSIDSTSPISGNRVEAGIGPARFDQFSHFFGSFGNSWPSSSYNYISLGVRGRGGGLAFFRDLLRLGRVFVGAVLFGRARRVFGRVGAGFWDWRVVQSPKVDGHPAVRAGLSGSFGVGILSRVNVRTWMFLVIDLVAGVGAGVGDHVVVFRRVGFSLLVVVPDGSQPAFFPLLFLHFYFRFSSRQPLGRPNRLAPLHEVHRILFNTRKLKAK